MKISESDKCLPNRSYFNTQSNLFKITVSYGYRWKYRYFMVGEDNADTRSVQQIAHGNRWTWKELFAIAYTEAACFLL